MRHKILIADDSLTIQKVIKITLANEPFDMDVSASAQELTAKVKSFDPDIVLLDFNLSADQTGYDLCKTIKSTNPQAKVFMLYGTFDNIDEDLLQEAGCDSKIVKPFDGTKFINTCRTLVDQLASADELLTAPADYDFEMDGENIPEPIEELPAQDDEAQWVMDAPTHEDTAEETQKVSEEVPQKSILEMQVEDWGISVPGVIGQDLDDHLDIPEVITLPREEDLEYPDMEELEFSSGPKLTPISELKPLNEEINDEPPLEATSDADVKRIEEQIEEESTDLWALDEVELADDIDDLPRVEPHKLEEVLTTFDADAHHGRDEIEYDDGDFEAKLRKQLEPLVEEYVKQYGQAMIEKIAWEVIPDLAENLIRKEIQKISDSILNP